MFPINTDLIERSQVSSTNIGSLDSEDKGDKGQVCRGGRWRCCSWIVSRYFEEVKVSGWKRENRRAREM
jgi:hypothetical protein